MSDGIASSVDHDQSARMEGETIYRDVRLVVSIYKVRTTNPSKSVVQIKKSRMNGVFTCINLI